MPHTVLLPVWARNPQARPQKVRNDGAVNSGPKTANRLASEAGSGSVTSEIIARIPAHRRFLRTRDPPSPPRRDPPGHSHHGQHARHTGPQTRTTVTQRIIAPVTRGWPSLGEPIVRHRGRYCYVSAVLPGHREPTPILRLRYQGSADRWAIGIYLASSGQYTESELPGSFGPKAGTPEEGIDDTFVLYAGPKSGR
jgi:hypothetical protein